MKNRIVILILAGLLVISFAGCNNKAQNKTTADQETGAEAVESVASGTEESDDTTSTSEEPDSQNKAENVQQDEMDDTAEKKESQTTESADGIKKEAETQKNVKTEKPAKAEEPKETETQKETVPAETKTPAATPTQAQTPAETPKAEETKTETPKAEESPAGEPKATAADSKAIADKVVQYINSYRSSPATKLSGLTGYAEYRSRQLIGNFAHDTDDERTAATALAYGTYIDPTLYGIEGTPYYTVNAREAIAKAGYTGTVDEVAESIAKLVRNSQSHWKYVGDSYYQYIGVGITYESGIWYCNIAVAAENIDNN